MKNKSLESSPQLYARIGGVLYLIMIILGIVAELVVRGKIIVHGNVAATAENLKSMESLWRFGIANEVILTIITICLGWITYYLTRPVNKKLALLALLFNMVATTVIIAYALYLIQALFPLDDAQYLKAFTPDQRYVITNMALRSHALGYGISLLLFGPFFFITGYLIIKSGYFPKIIGVLYLIPGLSYMTSSFALILAPKFADQYYFVIAGPALIGELSFCLWLLFKGVNLDKWNDKIISAQVELV